MKIAFWLLLFFRLRLPLLKRSCWRPFVNIICEWGRKGIDNVLNVNLFATENTWPDLTLLFDIKPELGLARIASNSNREVNRLDLEKLEFHNKVRETFLELAKVYPDRFVIIDASQDRDSVAKATLDAILSRLCK